MRGARDEESEQKISGGSKPRYGYIQPIKSRTSRSTAVVAFLARARRGPGASADMLAGAGQIGRMPTEDRLIIVSGSVRLGRNEVRQDVGSAKLTLLQTGGHD